jgi:DNA-binding transcriptional LysR family regulator
LFAPLFAIYRKRYPGIEIRLVEHGGERLKELLLSGEIELAASLLPVSDSIEWQEVRREPLTVLLSANDDLSRRRSVGLPALTHLPFILFETGFALNRIILDSCHRHGFEPDIVARSSQIDFIVELAAAGLGLNAARNPSNNRYRRCRAQRVFGSFRVAHPAARNRESPIRKPRGDL